MYNTLLHKTWQFTFYQFLTDLHSAGVRGRGRAGGYENIAVPLTGPHSDTALRYTIYIYIYIRLLCFAVTEQLDMNIKSKKHIKHTYNNTMQRNIIRGLRVVI